MFYRNFGELTEKVRAGSRKKVVLAAAHDPHALEAVLRASSDGVVDYILVGEPEKIRETATGLGFELGTDNIAAASGAEDSAQKAVKLVRDGEGDFLMKGGMETAALLRAALDKENGIRTDSTMSHVAIIEAPRYHKLFAVTDGGMIPHPTFEQKTLILKNAVELFKALGYDNPKVAVLTASESVNERMPETAEAAKLKEMAGEGFFGGCTVEGPISFDLTVSRESAEIKGYKSPVAADADIMMVPDITSGNILSKSLIYMGGAKMAGCIVGARAPIVLTSRGASAEEKHLSLLLSAALC